MPSGGERLGTRTEPGTGDHDVSFDADAIHQLHGADMPIGSGDDPTDAAVDDPHTCAA
jgi:hypothetical protein